MTRVLDRRVLLPLAALWVVCFIISAIQGEGEGGSFIEELPWILFLALTLFFLVVGVLAIVARARR